MGRSLLQDAIPEASASIFGAARLVFFWELMLLSLKHVQPTPGSLTGLWKSEVEVLGSLVKVEVSMPGIVGSLVVPESPGAPVWFTHLFDIQLVDGEARVR